MALGKKITEPRNVVLSIDPALDKKTNWDSYVENNYDESYLHFKKGEKPTWFRIRQLTSKMIDFTLRSEGRQSLLDTIRCGLIGIENFILEDANGAVTENHTPATEFNKELNAEIIKQDWIDGLNFSFNLAVELAGMIGGITHAVPLSLTKSKAAPGPGNSEKEK